MPRIQQHKTDTGYTYKGHTIHATRGLHEYAMEKLLAIYPSGGKHVLDIGCGSGAFTQRLHDHGFTTTSTDIDLSAFALNSEAHQLDLNANFHTVLGTQRYEVIVALEVIEHLENPLDFLRKIKQLMDHDSLLIVSFPNIYLHYAIRTFVEQGSFVNWDAFQYWSTGHQTILTDWLFEQHIKKTGLEVKEKYFCAPVEFPLPILKRLVYQLFFLLMRLLTPQISKAARLSDAIVFVVARPSCY
jgi:2-polyprenyl-3-methyl-5-hydroxy-6-metoxy-1,4-benzoquinol methylase